MKNALIFTAADSVANNTVGKKCSSTDGETAILSVVILKVCILAVLLDQSN